MSQLKDPRRGIAPYLPGLATHFMKGPYPFAACGTSVVRDRLTSDPQETTCRRCFRSPAWKVAWDAIVEKAQGSK